MEERGVSSPEAFWLLPNLLGRRLRQLPRIAADALVLSSGVAASQALTLFMLPVTARLFGPEQMGVLAVMLAFERILSPLACWRYEQAVMLPEEDHEAWTVVMLSLSIAAVMTVVLAAVLVVWGPDVARLLRVDELATHSWFLVLLLPVMGVSLTFKIWNSRRRAFSRTAFANSVRAGGIGIGQIGTGVAIGWTPTALLGGYLAGMAAESAVLSRHWVTGRLTRSPGALMGAARRYRKFPLLSVPGGLLAALQFGLLPLLLAAAFGAAEAGWFWVAFRLLNTPVALLAEPLGAVLYQRLAVLRRDGKGDAAGLIAQVGMSLFLVGLGPALLVLALAPPAASWLLGEEWRRAGLFAQALIPRALLSMVGLSVTSVYLAYERQEHMLAWHLAVGVAPLAGFVAGAWLGDELAATWAYSVVSAVVFAAPMVSGLLYAGVRWRAIPRALGRGTTDSVRLAAALVRPARDPGLPV